MTINDVNGGQHDGKENMPNKLINKNGNGDGITSAQTNCQNEARMWRSPYKLASWCGGGRELAGTYPKLAV